MDRLRFEHGIFRCPCHIFIDRQKRQKQPPEFKAFARREPFGENALDFLDPRPQRRQLLLPGGGEKKDIAALVHGIVRALDQAIANHARDQVGDGRTVHVELIAELPLIDARRPVQDFERRVLNARDVGGHLGQPHRDMALLGTAHEAARVFRQRVAVVLSGRQFG